MSDAAVASIITGLVSISTTIVGLLTLWIKVKYGVQKMEETGTKLDANTVITHEAKEAATKASEHSKACDHERAKIFELLSEHENRIANLETQIGILKNSVESVSKNIDSTRHEMRGHLQTLTNKLDIIGSRIPTATVVPAPAANTSGT